VNESRRKFLKIIFVGSGAVLMERIFGPLYSKFFSDTSAKGDSSAKAVPDNFKVAKNGDGLAIYDSAGEEIFQIDNEA
jgi:hypothetical protein